MAKVAYGLCSSRHKPGGDCWADAMTKIACKLCDSRHKARNLTAVQILLLVRMQVVR